MERKIDIHKAAGVLLRERKFLVTRSKGKDFFIAPGGKVEVGESVQDALRRELKEELQIDISVADLKDFGTFYALAAGREDKYLQMDVFLLGRWDGEIAPSAEVEDICWIGSDIPDGLELGSIFRDDVLPKLKSLDLID